MPRPSDEDYYVDQRTTHFAQGDIFRDVPFYSAGVAEDGDEVVPIAHEGYGILISYTSAMMQQPPGTRGYGHSWRLVAPVFSLNFLAETGLTPEQVERLRAHDTYMKYMYLPPYAGEFAESAAVLYRPALVSHDVIEGKRVTQLAEASAVRLQQRLASTFLGGKWREEDLDPDLSDHWELGTS